MVDGDDENLGGGGGREGERGRGGGGEGEEEEALRAMGLRRSCARAPPDPMDAEF